MVEILLKSDQYGIERRVYWGHPGPQTQLKSDQYGIESEIRAKECTKPRNNHRIGKSTNIKEVAALLKNVWTASIQCSMVDTCTREDVTGTHIVQNVNPATAVTVRETIQKKGEKKWIDIGIAYVNKKGSITVYLSALPLNDTLILIPVKGSE